MTDPLPPAPAAPPADASTIPAQAPAPAKRPGLFRPSGIILLLLLLVIAVAAVPLLVEPWIVGQVRSQLAARNLAINDDCDVSVSLFGGRVQARNVRLTETGQAQPVLVAEELDADLAVSDTLKSGDLIIDALVARGVSGSFRRRADGSVPLSPPGEPGTDWSKVDWTGYAQKVLDYLKQRRDLQEIERKKQEEEAKKPPEQRTPPTPPPPTKDPSGRWPKAVVYQPRPVLGGQPARLLIRRLDVSGTSLGLPDETAFDIARFALTGSDVAISQSPTETMTLRATVTTKGGGDYGIDLLRAPGEDGTLTIAAKQVPLQLLADPRIGGSQLAQYRPSGLGTLDLKASWTGDALAGTLASLLKDFALDPQPGAPREASEVARVANDLKGQEIAGPAIDLGGTLWAPAIAKVHVGEFLKDAATGAAKARALSEAQKQADKLLDKNPALKQATEQPALKKGLDALKGLGK